MRDIWRKAILWLGSIVIFALTIPTTALFAMIYGVSALVDRVVGTKT